VDHKLQNQWIGSFDPPHLTRRRCGAATASSGSILVSWSRHVSSALSSRLSKRRKLATSVQTATADQAVASFNDLPLCNSPEKWLATVAAWKAEQRGFGSGHTPANNLKLSFGRSCTAPAALGATTQSCAYTRKLTAA
jgi:hypothetical protein